RCAAQVVLRDAGWMVREQMLSGLEASLQGDVEPKLLRRRVPRGDWNSWQLKWIGPGGDGSAEARTATAEPSELHQVPICLAEVAPPTIGIGKGRDRRFELCLQIQPGADNLLPRLGLR